MLVGYSIKPSVPNIKRFIRPNNLYWCLRDKYKTITKNTIQSKIIRDNCDEDDTIMTNTRRS